MSMSKKDFVAIAEKMQRANNIMPDESFADGIAYMMAAFKEINPNFKPSVFMKACNMSQEQQNKSLVMFNLISNS